MGRTVVLPAAPLDVAFEVALRAAPDAGRIERGRYLYDTRGCAECHGVDGAGAGKTFVKDGGMFVVAPNITAGANGVTVRYTALDWVRTLRHGVKPNGNPVLLMPSEDYSRLSGDDMRALVAYLQQMRPLAGLKAVIQVPAPFKALYAFGVIQDASEKIDHSLAPPRAPEPGVTPAYGAYVAAACSGCHGIGMSGGRIHNGPPSWPAAANLTPGKGGVMPRYPTADAFVAMLRSGHRPDGSTISPVMPFRSLRRMSDVDVRALYAYLKTVPARATGQL